MPRTGFEVPITCTTTDIGHPHHGRLGRVRIMPAPRRLTGGGLPASGRLVLCLTAAFTLALSTPVEAQFATVPVAPAPTPYDVRFGADSAARITPSQRDSLRAAARAELRAWVDSAAAGLGIGVNLPDSISVPVDSVELDSIARQTGTGGARVDTARRDSIRADSVRRDSLARDSVRRARPGQPPEATPEQLGAKHGMPGVYARARHVKAADRLFPAYPGEPHKPLPDRHTSVRYDVVLPSSRHPGQTRLH